MLREMMEMCCLWQHISPSLKKMLGSGTGYDKIVEAWKMGSLDCSIIGVCNLMLQSLILQMRPTSDVFWLLTGQVKDRPVSLRFLFRVSQLFRPVCHGKVHQKHGEVIRQRATPQDPTHLEKDGLSEKIRALVFVHVNFSCSAAS